MKENFKTIPWNKKSSNLTMIRGEIEDRSKKYFLKSEIAKLIKINSKLLKLTIINRN